MEFPLGVPRYSCRRQLVPPCWGKRGPALDLLLKCSQWGGRGPSKTPLTPLGRPGWPFCWGHSRKNSIWVVDSCLAVEFLWGGGGKGKGGGGFPRGLKGRCSLPVLDRIAIPGQSLSDLRLSCVRHSAGILRALKFSWNVYRILLLHVFSCGLVGSWRGMYLEGGYC